jgi:hypothetical protein
MLNVAAGAGAGAGPEAGSSVITSVVVTLPAFPVIVTLTDWLTALETALKPILSAPAATTTVAGTVNAALLLDSDTVVELVAASLKYTEHAWVVGPVNVCVPHEIMLNVAAGVGAGPEAGSSVITSVFVKLPTFPVIVTVSDWLTALETALNPVVSAPAATTTVLGTVSAALLLVRDTVTGLVAAALKYTEHAWVVGPVNVCVPHEIMFNVGAFSEFD